MSYMKEYMFDQVYKLGEKAGLPHDVAEDIYLNTCDGDFEAYHDFIHAYTEFKACLMQNFTESMACEKDI